MGPKDEPDEWVFETVRAATVAQKKSTKRRKLSLLPSNGHNGQMDTEDAFSKLDIKDSPLQPSSPAPSTIKRHTVRKHPSLAHIGSTSIKSVSPKKPLQPDMNFGNGASTVRVFRRVSDNSTASVLGDSIGQRDENRPPMAETLTKEGQLGRGAYNKAVDTSFQELHAQTSNHSKREALSRLADAWSTLDAVDPDGEFQLLKLVIEKVQGDPQLSALLPASRDGTPQGTPHKVSQGPRLVMAQNNPHLRSHRQRKQSLQVAEDPWKEKVGHLPGLAIPGMEHTKQLADVIYGRWSDGLRNRWPAI